ncbi:DNA-directed DNA polymerase [Tanacetum coccineum]
MEEMLYKFIKEGKHEQEEMRAFIHEFRTTNELLFKERNNSLSELRFEVQGLLKVINNTPISNLEAKGGTTRGGKTMTQYVQDNDTNINTKELLVINHDEPVESNEVLTKDQSQKADKPVVQQTSLLTNRARLEEACTITMNERCSAVLLNKLPSKEKDPGSFIIPCDIGQLHINNALADLGASISLIPYTMYEKLGLGEPKAIRISLELVDRSIRYPRGIAKNVLIKVDKFVLPIHFVILDMPEDSRVPINLGRLFLATARAIIDVFNKKITLKVGDDEVIFDMDQSIMRSPTEDDECYRTNDLDDAINGEAQELLANDTTDSFLLKGLEKSIEQSDLESCEYEAADDSDSIRRIEAVNTPYPVKQNNKVEMEQLYSVSPIHVVPKKGGMTVVLNDNNELIPSRTVTGWRVCIDYQEEIADKFPDEHLMILKTKLNEDEPWYADYDEPYAFKLCPDNIMRRCVAGDEIHEILAHCHSGPTGGHHSASITRRKVYEAGLVWHNIFKDAKDYVIRCDACQRSGNISSRTKNRFMELNELMELRDGAYKKTRIYKERTKKWHDSRLGGNKDFKVGDKDLESKEINEVGEVSIIWSPMCDYSHDGIQTHLQHIFLLINSTWRIYRAKYQGSFSF